MHGYLKYWFSWETLSCWINVHFLCLNCMIYKSGKQNCVVSLWTQNKLNTNENSKRRRIRRLNFCQLFNLAWTVHTAPCCACVPSSTCNLKEYLCPPNILTNNCLHKNSNTDNAAICLVYYVALKTLQDKQSQYYCVCVEQSMKFELTYLIKTFCWISLRERNHIHRLAISQQVC